MIHFESRKLQFEQRKLQVPQEPQKTPLDLLQMFLTAIAGIQNNEYVTVLSQLRFQLSFPIDPVSVTSDENQHRRMIAQILKVIHDTVSNRIL